ncbi:MAG TPA: SUF system NifU family Fe-S cluster assembly protein [Pyrinomonadaceae bacterium]|nr:SUF system NifU family Fe-S cluster assembly protein [Pyrinomonadaceae bacterium]
MPVLYSDLLLDHFRHPRNYGSLEAPDVSYEAFNPLCGDRIRIEVKLDNEIISEARFKGDGCAISMAAASLLTELIVGKEMISDEELISALQSDIQPARIQCAILPLTALRDGLEHR